MTIKFPLTQPDITLVLWAIEDLLQRRSDLSTFLLHFTRAVRDRSSKDNLLSIMRDSKIEARTCLGMGKDTAPDDASFQESQRVVCFTETPIEHAWMMCADIAGRANSIGPHGIAFTKVWARANHANPVWYLDISARGGRDWLTQPFNALRDDGLKRAQREQQSLARYPISQILPFLEQMGPTCVGRKEFWWEREWRHVGSLAFSWSDVVAVFAPTGEHGYLRDAMTQMGNGGCPPPPFLDPNWGLERMVSALRGVSPSEAGPLPPSGSANH